jgi:predicted SnoaL-like aldol condensation-catalyzing enzyme
MGDKISCFSLLLQLHFVVCFCLHTCREADIVRIENGRLAEHWDVLQDEATKAESKSGLPMFGDAFAK